MEEFFSPVLEGGQREDTYHCGIYNWTAMPGIYYYALLIALILDAVNPTFGETAALCAEPRIKICILAARNLIIFPPFR